MNWKKIFGLGVVLWILMFAVISVFIAFKIYDFVLIKIVGVIIAGAIVYVLAGYANLKSVAQALSLGLSWIIIGLILDWLITYRFNNQFFYMWSLWAGYLLTLAAPILRIKKT